jgi:hypothetical protein
MENVSHNTSYDSADNLSRDPNPVLDADFEGYNASEYTNQNN